MFTAQQLEKIVITALNMPAQQRDAYMQEACGGNLELLECVKSRITQAEAVPSSSLQHDPNAMLGKSIGPYEIDSLLGVGGMGIIYLANDSRLQRQVAIKCLPPHLTTEKNYRERFFNEAKAVSSLEHPNICSLYDIGETADRHLYIAMPYYAGETLEQRLQQGPLPIADAINISLQMAAGLHAAHIKGVIHRDIKPANVMLTSGNVVKLLDFGVAKISGINMTSTGVSLGTVAYMSPEQLCGEKVDARTDIWALGNILYEMLVGRRPFKGDQAPAIIHAVLYADYPDLTLPEGFPTALNPILRKMLARDLGDRYASAQDLINALSEFSGGHDLSGYIQYQPPAPANRAEPNTSSLDQSLLDEMAGSLTTHLGPIASVLVSKYAKITTDVSSLCLKLQDHLPDETARTKFRKQFQTRITQADALASTPGQPAQPLLQAHQVDCLADILTSYIGPIASKLATRYAKQADNAESLRDMLCDHIDDDADKFAFKSKAKDCLK